MASGWSPYECARSWGGTNRCLGTFRSAWSTHGSRMPRDSIWVATISHRRSAWGSSRVGSRLPPVFPLPGPEAQAIMRMNRIKNIVSSPVPGILRCTIAPFIFLHAVFPPPTFGVNLEHSPRGLAEVARQLSRVEVSRRKLAGSTLGCQDIPSWFVTAFRGNGARCSAPIGHRPYGAVFGGSAVANPTRRTLSSSRDGSDESGPQNGARRLDRCEP